MIKVKNQKVVSEIAATTYKANKKRNLLTIAAIMMTTFLIGVVLAIGISYWNTISLRQIRMNGMDYDIELTEPREDQVELMRAMDKVETAGISVKCAILEKYDGRELGKVQLYWLDQVAWKLQCIPALESVTGEYPNKEDEIMLSESALKAMGIAEPEIGMKLPAAYYVLAEEGKQEILTKDFSLSGYFKDYTGKDKGFVSELFFRLTGAKQTDLTQGTLRISLKNPLYSEKDITKMQKEVSLDKMQMLISDPDTISSFFQFAAVLVGMLGMVLASGYLFIYNTLYISVSKDIRFYGQLKTIGVTSVQLRGIMLRQVIWNSFAGIPIGLGLGIIVANGIIPEILHMANPTLSVKEIVPVQPWSYLLAGTFAFLTNLFGSRKPAKIVGDCPPIEAMRYISGTGKGMGRKSGGGGTFSMAWRNMFRDKKQAVVILSSFIIAVTIFLIVNVVIRGNDARSILNAMYPYDIQIKNETVLDDKLPLITEEKINQIEKTSGVVSVGTVSSTEAIVPYQETVFGEYYKALYQSRYTPGGNYEEDMALYKERPEYSLFTSRLIGINSVEFERLNASLGNILDEAEFEEGKTAVAIKGFQLEVGGMIGKTVRFSLPDGSDLAQEQSVQIAAVSNPSVDPSAFAGGYTPALIVSQKYVEQLLPVTITELIDVKYAEAFSKTTERKVKEIFAGEDKVTYDSKLERYSEMAKNEMQVKVLGNSIGIIMALLAVLNYFNMMAASVQNRSKELATLESIGMTTKQIKKVLALEGIGYAACSIIVSLLAGIPLSYIVFQNMNIYRITYTVPWGNNLVLFAGILLLCVIVPVSLYQKIQKDSIIVRLRDGDE